ncbi:MAG: ADP-ribosylation factor-like protein [Candidatus Kariarchaeaceae archaeon]|jgi:GTPase SAR1 family protein
MRRILKKVVLIGSESKSNLRRSFFGQNFETKNILDTLGCDFSVKQVEVLPDFTVEFQVWDINTLQKFKNLREKYYNGLKSIILMFDSSYLSSLYALEQWFSEICELEGCEDKLFIILSTPSIPGMHKVTPMKDNVSSIA